MTVSFLTEYQVSYSYHIFIYIYIYPPLGRFTKVPLPSRGFEFRSRPHGGKLPGGDFRLLLGEEGPALMVGHVRHHHSCLMPVHFDVVFPFPSFLF